MPESSPDAGSRLPALQAELVAAGATLARPLAETDYHNAELVIEDVDGRWIGFGMKEDGSEPAG